LKQRGEEPESGQFWHAFRQIAQIAEVEPDAFDEDGRAQNGDQDEFVQVVQVGVLDPRGDQGGHEPEGEVANVEEQAHLKLIIHEVYEAEKS